MNDHFRSRVSLEGLPSAGSLFAYPLRNWEEAAGRAGLPAIGVKVREREGTFLSHSLFRWLIWPRNYRQPISIRLLVNSQRQSIY